MFRTTLRVPAPLETIVGTAAEPGVPRILILKLSSDIPLEADLIFVR